MYLSEVSVDGVFESVHRGSCYNLLWESIPCVNNTLTEVVLSDIKPCSRFIQLERISSCNRVVLLWFVLELTHRQDHWKLG